jgi:hypothetical protein
VNIFYGVVVAYCCVVLGWVILEALASHWNRKARR